MKRYIALLAALFLSACAPTQSHYVGASQTNLGSNLPHNLIKQQKQRFNNNGLLEIELVLQSNFTKDVFYKVEWLDKDGFVLRNPVKEDYQLLRIPSGQEVVLRKLAFDKRAVDFRIDMRTKN
ncbi:YcfL family protein [Campylobacter upsaliensis]|uniref:YcfL family protein n=1 Tax=Campylobacter upsaliensis TaxID=28080 RepID=UPI0022EA83FF|nr:YcfL family protein [Campylobacter upsaliensis]ELS3708649.1 YcfL family protein [Campylobacter upsaliensis]MEB2792346.1 YcfL family protein [Campylobacter upsaliensis]MEB2807880.1 YcfL family protein [Campylobacter upsaliensis]MEB2819641.1 YcfL family protein [Campylobacter upsaliensis]